MKQVLVADIGGTNARFALYDHMTQTLSVIKKFTITAEMSLQQLIINYLNECSTEIERACLAIACPIEGDWIDMTNNHIQFSRSELQAALGLKQLAVINDFTAVAMSIPALQPKDVCQVGGTQPDTDYPVAIYGAGTGLGVAHLIKTQQQWLSLPGEGGHVELPMISEYENQVLAHLRQKFGRVSAERLLSGNGLVNIYQALAAMQQLDNTTIDPKDIVDNALNQSCSLCVETLTLFCALMGRFGGNLALTLNTKGGVYIAGGIVPRFIEFFKQSDFRKNFEQKGRMGYLLKTIPVYVVVHPDPGLLGAGMYLQQQN
ncbi:glucokinase [Orbus hercynius]|uniref:Glucokinase n=1 Tax=Orbus hercynius TaxID=593135 RepID=A0A495RKJ8_9GAMM|nr:glucokinase [Orbus hercynius]RKS87686.1 glucokinase [Orbus hercynius]